MTRKDYVAIAAAMVKAYQAVNALYAYDDMRRSDATNGVSAAIDSITKTLAKDNPRFDEAKFTAACRKL